MNRNQQIGLGLVVVIMVAILAFATRSQVPTTVISTAPVATAPSATRATPTATAPAQGTASSAPTAAATFRPATRPALVTRRGQDTILRSESDVAPIRTIPGGVFSADGGRIAYWTEAGGTAALHVLELPSNDSIVSSFPNLRAGGIAWSVEGSGLLVSLAEADPQFLIPRIVMAVEIGPRKAREVYRGIGPSGASVVPLIWRGPPELFVMYETGPGGFHFGYTVVRPGSPPVRTEPDGRVTGMQASSDGSLVQAFWLDEQAIRIWPAEDFSRKTAELKIAPAAISQPLWWPGRREVVYARGQQDAGSFRDQRIERWDPATGTRSAVLAMTTSPQLRAYFLRADGSGALTQTGVGTREVTDLRTNASSPVPLQQGEVILSTVLIP
jgi:hypothetical protein